MDTLQKRLKAARLNAGLSQGDVARRAGISQPTYSDLERIEGKGTKHLVKIAKVLGVRPEWLASGSGPQTGGLASVADSELSALWQDLSEDQRKLFLRMIRAAASEEN